MDPSYEPVITTGGGIIMGLIAIFGAIQVALINNTRKDAKAAREQTENDHARDPNKVTNLRDNIDVNHDSIMSKLDTIVEKQNRQDRRQDRQDEKIDKLFSVSNQHTDEIDELTHPKIRKTE